MGVRGCAWVWEGVGRRGVRGCAWVYACVWDEFSVNFQKFFWRIESLHQRTLIRILYEFLFLDPQLATNFGTGITSLASEGGTSED